MRRMNFYRPYTTGDSQTETSKYTWEDLEAAQWNTSASPTSPDSLAEIEIKKYFRKYPEEAIDGKYSKCNVDDILKMCIIFQVE